MPEQKKTDSKIPLIALGVSIVAIVVSGAGSLLAYGSVREQNRQNRDRMDQIENDLRILTTNTNGALSQQTITPTITPSATVTPMPTAAVSKEITTFKQEEFGVSFKAPADAIINKVLEGPGGVIVSFEDLGGTLNLNKFDSNKKPACTEAIANGIKITHENAALALYRVDRPNIGVVEYVTAVNGKLCNYYPVKVGSSYFEVDTIADLRNPNAIERFEKIAKSIKAL